MRLPAVHRVLSDWLVISISANPGESFLDRMISMVEGANAAQDAERNRAQRITRCAMTSLIFLLACVNFAAVFSCTRCSQRRARRAGQRSLCLIALLVCLIPTTIGGLLSAIGIAGMDRLIQANVIAMSGRAVEAAGDADVLLLDKTGTITSGNRQAVAFCTIPAPGVSDLRDLARRRAVMLSLRR